MNKLCRIKPEYCESEDEKTMLYHVLEGPNKMGRYLIQPIDFDGTITPTELIDGDKIYFCEE